MYTFRNSLILFKFKCRCPRVGYANWFVCVSICLSVCICMLVYLCVHTVGVCVCVHDCMWVCVCVKSCCVCVCTCGCIFVCVYMPVCVCLLMCVCVCVHEFACVCACVCVCDVGLTAGVGAECRGKRVQSFHPAVCVCMCIEVYTLCLFLCICLQVFVMGECMYNMFTCLRLLHFTFRLLTKHGKSLSMLSWCQTWLIKL